MENNRKTMVRVCKECGCRNPASAGSCKLCGTNLLRNGTLEQVAVSGATVQHNRKCRNHQRETMEVPSRSKLWVVPAALLLVLAIALALAFDTGRLCFRRTPEPGELLSREDRTLCNESGTWSNFCFGSLLPNNLVGSVTFLDSVEEAPMIAWDASPNKNRSVLGWAVWNDGLFDVYIAAEGGVVAPADCSDMFTGGTIYENLTRIDFGGNLDTSGVTDMSGMFRQCKKLRELDIGSLQTDNVTDMEYLFWDCHALTELDLSGLQTGNVLDMKSMFEDCRSLKTLDLTGFDTTQVSDMTDMFYHCDELTELDLTGWDLDSLEYHSNIFKYCPAGARWEHMFD